MMQVDSSSNHGKEASGNGENGQPNCARFSGIIARVLSVARERAIANVNVAKLFPVTQSGYGGAQS